MALNERTLSLDPIYTARSGGLGRDPYEEKVAKNTMQLIVVNEPKLQPLLDSMYERRQQVSEVSLPETGFESMSTSGDLQLGKEQLLLIKSETIPRVE